MACSSPARSTRPGCAPAGTARAHGEPDRDTGPAVLVERQGATLSVTLDRPHVHNAFNLALRDGLVEALQLADLDPTIASVELRGNGPSFCSGGDLTEFGTVPDPVTGHVVRTTRSAALALWRVADRVTVHLHGACVGAGIELAALAGRVVAHPDSRLRLPEVGFGLVPGAGGTASVPLRIGRARTAWLALSGSDPRRRDLAAVGTGRRAGGVSGLLSATRCTRAAARRAPGCRSRSSSGCGAP